MLLADIAHGQTTGADICFLVAVILFLIGAFIAFQVKTIYATIICLGLAATALGLLLL